MITAPHSTPAVRPNHRALGAALACLLGMSICVQASAAPWAGDPTNDAAKAPAVAAPPAPAAPATSGDAAAPPAVAPAAPTTLETFRRVGLIGASATAGFGVRLDTTTPDGSAKEVHAADLGDVLRAACSEPIVISRFGSIYFYDDPLGTGPREIDRVLRFGPTCVIGVDFLFWYGYGFRNIRGEPMRDESERLELLEEGLRQLDRVVQLGVPVVVGDFPDMSDSIGRILQAAQVPAKPTLVRLNARLAEWAATRSNVRVLHLSSLVPRLESGESLIIRGAPWSREQYGTTLQRDRLHPTFMGCVALMASACELAETCTSDGVCGKFSFDRETLIPRFLEAKRRGRGASNTPVPDGGAPAARESAHDTAPVGTTPPQAPAREAAPVSTTPPPSTAPAATEDPSFVPQRG